MAMLNYASQRKYKQVKGIVALTCLYLLLLGPLTWAVGVVAFWYVPSQIIGLMFLFLPLFAGMVLTTYTIATILAFAKPPRAKFIIIICLFSAIGSPIGLWIALFFSRLYF